MPKDKKERRGRYRSGRSAERLDADPGETNSVVTQDSLTEDQDLDDVSSTLDETEMTEDAISHVEDTLKEHFENASHKNPKIREAALRAIIQRLSRCYLPDFLLDWRVTLTDSLERAAKRSATSSCSAHRAGALLPLQISLDAHDCMADMVEAAGRTANDVAQPIALRAECCYFIACYVFFAEEELEIITKALDLFANIWSKVKSSCPPEVAPLFTAALTCWCWVLLHPNLMMVTIQKTISINLPKLTAFLSAGQVEMRICAAESIALIYELHESVIAPDVRYRPPHHQNILTLLQEMLAESAKYYAKRDKRAQRGTVRDVIATIADGVPPTVKIRFGVEVLEIDSWYWQLTYDALCHILGSGMHSQLKNNSLIRSVFSLGPPLVNPAANRLSKLQRQMQNMQVSKARTQLRTKQRQRAMRSDVLEDT